MQKFSYKIAFSIIVASLFIVVSFAALNYENLYSPFYIVSGTLLAFIFLFGFAMGHIYSKPVRELLTKASDVSNGNFKNKAEVKTKDEIEELSKVFNKMTEGLEKSAQEVETIKKTSDIKFKTKDIVSEKVIDALEAKIKNRTSELERAVAETEQLKKQLKIKEKMISDLTNKGRKKDSHAP